MDRSATAAAARVAVAAVSALGLLSTLTGCRQIDELRGKKTDTKAADLCSSLMRIDLPGVAANGRGQSAPFVPPSQEEATRLASMYSELASNAPADVAPTLTEISKNYSALATAPAEVTEDTGPDAGTIAYLKMVASPPVQSLLQAGPEIASWITSHCELTAGATAGVAVPTTRPRPKLEELPPECTALDDLWTSLPNERVDVDNRDMLRRTIVKLEVFAEDAPLAIRPDLDTFALSLSDASLTIAAKGGYPSELPQHIVEETSRARANIDAYAQEQCSFSVAIGIGVKGATLPEA